MTQSRARLASAIIALCLLPPTGLTPEQHLGKQIYLSGTSVNGGEITARVGKDDAAVPAAVLPCANCHGRDGRGRSEGGVISSDITWSALTKPYAVANAGRSRLPYTDTLLKRAIVMGLDSSGNTMDSTMPRFQMKLTDLDDLISYLHVLGSEVDPGITESELRLGVVLAAGPRFAETRAAVRFVLNAWQNDINAGGGIFGRKLVLRFLDPPEDAQQRMAAIRDFIDRESIFALLATSIAGIDRQMSDFVSEKELPVIGAYSLYPQTATPLNRYLFYLQPGIAEQGRDLAVFATRHLGRPPLHAIVVEDPGQLSAPVGQMIEAECSKLGWAGLQKVNAGMLTEKRWQSEGEVVLVLAPDTFAKLIALDTAVKSQTRYLVPASLIDLDVSTLPLEVRSRIFIAYPALPSDAAESGLSYYRRLTAGPPHVRRLEAEWAALASARLLAYTLQSTGRNLSREQLIESLEGIYQYPTELLPPVSFGPNRRIGSAGAHIVDATHLGETGEWVDPD